MVAQCKLARSLGHLNHSVIVRMYTIQHTNGPGRLLLIAPRLLCWTPHVSNRKNCVYSRSAHSRNRSTETCPAKLPSTVGIAWEAFWFLIFQLIRKYFRMNNDRWNHLLDAHMHTYRNQRAMIRDTNQTSCIFLLRLKVKSSTPTRQVTEPMACHLLAETQTFRLEEASVQFHRKIISGHMLGWWHFFLFKHKRLSSFFLKLWFASILDFSLNVLHSVIGLEQLRPVLPANWMESTYRQISRNCTWD